ncbi:urease accessory protein UreF [Candidatus Thiosymbion oneisti]|nr:urease accessory UreF family protein [Candidatus Thiosymbion oneisti]
MAQDTGSTDDPLPLLRLLQLVSPSLPIGGFAYSQGIEWAVEAGWIRSAEQLQAWLLDQLGNSLVNLDLPLLARMYDAARVRDLAAMIHWIDWLLAARETSELRAEEANRGRALADLLIAWELTGARDWKTTLARSQAAGFAFAAAAWAIPVRNTALGYAWGWLENLVLAGIKIIPLGRAQGQRILQRLAAEVPAAVARALALADHEIGASTPALAIASSAHETQYTRLFRS